MENENTQTSSNTPPRPVIVVFRWLGVIIWAGVIIFLSSNSSSNLSGDLGFFSSIYQQLQTWQENIFGSGVDVLSPIGHFLEYFVLSFMLVNALWQHMSLKRACIVAVIIASAFGVTDEIHQYFVPERMADPLDWVVDTIGATIGALIAHPVLRKVDKGMDPK